MDIAVSKKLDKVFPYLMLLPAIVLFIMFVISPFFYGFYTSLFRWDGLSEMKWLGFTNYKHVFGDPQFWNAIKNTFIYAIVITVFKNGIGLALALMLISRKHGTTFCRTALYMPVTFSYVVIGVLWIWVYNPTFGILDGVLDVLGLEFLSKGWLSDPNVALYSVAAVDIWKWIGFHLVLYFTGLQAIPETYYEAADIDGANWFHKFWHITIPQLNSVIVMNVLLAITGAFVNNYNLVNVMTQGGPFGSTEVSLTYIVRTAFSYRNLGQANAMSMVLFAMVFVIGFAQFKVMTKEETTTD